VCPGARGAIGVAIALLLLPLASACGGNPPQIVDYAPQRNAVDVSTAVPVRISFDHDVDRLSVMTRLHLVPATPGNVIWTSPRQLVYQHPTLKPSTAYEVVLEAGYRDLAGNTYTLRHHWAFVTERPPSLVSTTPANADTGIDPAAYLTLDFTREMDAASMKGAITISPTVPFSVRLDPTDGRRAIVAPDELLGPNTTYTLSVNTSALDADGNQVGRDQSAEFTTGAVRPLHHWVAFATDGAGGSPRGLWIVNESGFPRQLFDSSAVRSFSWSPDGGKLLIQGDGESWFEFAPGSGTVALGFKASWAAALAFGMGYVYLDDGGTLHRLGVNGADVAIASDVAEATVAPGGLRVGFVHGSAPNEIWGYDVGLRASYQLALDTASIGAMSWAPAGNRIAYLRSDLGTTSLRVRSLTGSATTTTIASGDLGPPAWLPDSTHIVFAAATQTATGTTHKAFVVDVVSPPTALSAAAGLPSDPSVDLTAPVPSPDGHQIAFVSGDQVWLMNADGTRPTALTRFDPESFPYSCRAPAWTLA
jgi:Big-like domain-containing protein